MRYNQELEETLIKRIQSYIFLIGTAGLIVALDQWTKQIVRANLAFQEIWSPFEWLAPYARIVHWRNTGAAFGLFQDGNLIFTILAFIVSGLILLYFPHIPHGEWLIRLAIAMQLGGAVGNLIDRLTQGHVTDFISVGSFAVFNVADASISVGVVILLLGVWLAERAEKAQQKAEAELAAQAVTAPAVENEENG